MIAAPTKRTFSKMHSHTISLPGQTLAAISANESAPGPPVVFILGITSSVNLWLPSMPAEIRDGRRWISLSLPGHPAKVERSAIESWDDVISEMWAGWSARHGVGPPDCLPLTKLAKLTNHRAISLPYWSMKLATTIWWGLRLSIFDFPPNLHHFARYPWVVSPARLQNELGFQFRYSCEETLLKMWAEHRRKKRS